MQRLSLGAEMEDVYRGFVAEKDKLVWESAGDWEREPHGGETGDVANDVWEGLVVEILWPTMGDWHLDPHGEVVVPVWRDLELGTVEGWVFWLTMGDWLLDPQGGEQGDVTLDDLDMGIEVTVEDCACWFTIGD